MIRLRRHCLTTLGLCCLWLPMAHSESVQSSPPREYSERQLERAQAELFDALGEPWYRIEFIVFERLSVLTYNSEEQLLQRGRRTIPRGAQLLADAGPAAAASYPESRLDLAHCLGYPLFPERLPPHPLTLNAIGPAYNPQALRESDAQLEVDAQNPTAFDEPLDTSGFTSVAPATADAAVAAADTGSAAADNGATNNPALNELINNLRQFKADLVDRSLTAMEQLEMETEVKLINRRRHLRPLLHMGWIQAVPPRDAPAPVEVSYQEAPLPAKLVGHIGLTLGRYLHLSADLWYSTPALGWQPQPVTSHTLPGSNFTRLTAQHMRLYEQRRMKSGELHYLDHPKLGVIARVDPVPIPQSLVRAYLDLERPDLRSLLR